MRSLTLLLFLPFILAECPEGWWKAGDACYFISQQHMSWFEAQEVRWANSPIVFISLHFIEKKNCKC